MKNFKESGKRFFFVIILVGVILTIMITIHIALERKMNIEQEHIAENDIYRYHIAMIGNNPSDDFWIRVYEEAKEAGGKVGCYVENFGMNLAENYSVKNLLEMAIASKVDGIILQADEGDGLKELIDEAVQREIPVMTMLSDAPNSSRISFVSCNNYGVGEMYGSQVLEAVKESVQKGDGDRKRRVTVLVNSGETNATPNLIYSGITDATASVADQMEISTVQVNRSGKFESEETVRKQILSKEYPDVIVCLSAVDTISAYQSVVDYNMVGKVAIIGYYSSDEILKKIQKGIIKSTLSINAKELGGTAVDGMYEYITKAYVSEYLPVTSELITNENVEKYLKEEGKGGSYEEKKVN